MILIFTKKNTPRLSYVTQLIFLEILQTEISITTDPDEFLSSKLPRLNYSGKRLADEFYLEPHSLLFQQGLAPVNIKAGQDNGEKFFFETSDSSDFPFDVLAASFYLVSRYEEYIKPDRDKYNRFPATKSILSELNLLKRPVIDIWANRLAEKLQKKYPQLVFPKRKAEFISTIDIDNAWAYLHKGFWRTCGAIFKAAAKGKLPEVIQRIKVLAGKEKDPYDTYGFLNSIFEGNENNTRFFFLLGNYAQFDRSCPRNNKKFRELIYKTAQKYPVGIHPSFFSGTKNGEKNLPVEIVRLGKITGKRPERSRQHFLRLAIPETYRRLIKAGIKEDYTMGFASQTGFRAGTSTPFYFYDLKEEKTTNLRVIPFQVMDVTLRDYMKLSPKEAQTEIERLMEEVKKNGGIFVSIWHNESVNDLRGWKGFREVFEKMNKTGFEWVNE